MLIYDYERVTRDVSESDALAFTIHRFIREHVRWLKKADTNITNDTVGDLVDLFLENYTDDGTDEGMELPKDFRENIRVEIRRTNFRKLLYLMLCLHRIRWDAGKRRQKKLVREIEKFIAYIKEAEYF